MAASTPACPSPPVFPSLEEAAGVYREYASLPSPVRASLRKTGEGALALRTDWTQRDLERSEKVKFQSVHLVLAGSGGGDRFGTVVNAGCSQEMKPDLLSSLSPSGKRRAVIREVKNKKGDEKQYLEIWDGRHKTHNVDLQAQEKHGKVYEDELFGSLAWSSAETHLVYIAERKKPKTTSYFDPKSQAAKKEATDKAAGDPDEPVKGDENLLQEDWGETLMSKQRPVVCVLDIRSQTVRTVEGIPDGISAGHAVWSPDDSGIVFVGWFQEPYRLGIRYCYNRRSALYFAQLDDKECEVLSATDGSIWCPRFSPDKTKLVYLRNEAGGPHQHCSQVVMYDWATKVTTVVVDVVSKPSAGAPFPGVYSFGESPAKKCWLSDSRRLVLSTVWGSQEEIVLIDTDKCSVTRLTSDPEFGAWVVLDVMDDTIVAARSAPDKPHELVVGEVAAEAGEEGVEWTSVVSSPGRLDHLTWEVIPMKSETSSSPHGVTDYEVILVSPKQVEGPPPLIVLPHGGPHSSIVAEFIMSVAAFCKLGFAILLVNYRGSLGCGEASILSLPGNVGRQDVDDVHNAVRTVVHAGKADERYVVLSGGSHGGFLVTHLIGQFPSYYKACATRNPVVNIASMLGSTDIPDWTYVEAGFVPFDFGRLPTEEVYSAMLRKSPIFYAHKVTTPTLIMIGDSDLRVPPKQGQEFYRALKARGNQTKMLVYKDNNHSLGKVDAEADCFVNTYKWFTSFE